jgi:hypothetical protein
VEELIAPEDAGHVVEGMAVLGVAAEIAVVDVIAGHTSTLALGDIFMESLA